MGQAGHPNDVLLQGGPMHMHFQPWGCPRPMRHRPHDQTVNLPTPSAPDAPAHLALHISILAQSSYSQGVSHTCARHDEQPAQQQQLRSHLAVEMHCFVSFFFVLSHHFLFCLAPSRLSPSFPFCLVLSRRVLFFLVSS